MHRFAVRNACFCMLRWVPESDGGSDPSAAGGTATQKPKRLASRTLALFQDVRSWRGERALAAKPNLLLDQRAFGRSVLLCGMRLVMPVVTPVAGRAGEGGQREPRPG